MGNVPVKNENNKTINEDASKLIEAAKKALDYNLDWSTAYKLDDAEKASLEKLDTSLQGAKIVFNKDGKGATVLSSSGAVVSVGQEYKVKDYEDMNDKEKADYDLAFHQTYYAFKEAVAALNSGGVINSEEKQKLEELGKVLPNTSIMVTEDGLGLIVADTYGRHLEAGSTDASPGVYVGGGSGKSKQR